MSDGATLKEDILLWKSPKQVSVIITMNFRNFTKDRELREAQKQQRTHGHGLRELS